MDVLVRIRYESDIEEIVLLPSTKRRKLDFTFVSIALFTTSQGD